MYMNEMQIVMKSTVGNEFRKIVILLIVWVRVNSNAKIHYNHIGFTL